VDDRPRLLAKGNGYTARSTRAMDPSEPEAVSAEDQRNITLQAARNWPHLSALHTAERTAQPMSRRLERIKAQARFAGVDVHNQLRQVRLAMEGGRSAAHIERRVEAIEQRLWPGQSP
jgi:hypothetical protein